MQAIAALHAQLSAATEQLEFANARLEFLRNDNKVIEETKNLQEEELYRLTELLAATADDETKDAQLLAEQEAETAALVCLSIQNYYRVYPSISYNCLLSPTYPSRRHDFICVNYNSMPCLSHFRNWPQNLWKFHNIIHWQSMR